MPKAKRKSCATWLMIDLWSNGINYEEFGDREAESHLNYVAGDDSDHKYNPTDMQFEKNHHKWLQLDSGVIGEILNDATDWGKIREKMSEYHTEAFDTCLSEDLGFELELKHSSGDTAEIKLSVAKRLLRMMKRDDWAAFKEVFEEEDNHHPRRESDELTQRPLIEWESNQLGWLLQAALKIGKEMSLRLSTLEMHARRACGLPTTKWVRVREEQEFDSAVDYEMLDREGGYHAWSNSVDWDTYNRKVQEARQHLFDELTEEDQQWLIDHGHWDGVLSWNARCPLTLELPLGDLIGNGADNLSLSQTL